MLSLDSPLWGSLRHTYGNAADVPDLLRQLERAPSQYVAEWTGPWKELWEALCHGGIEIYTASYAAVPHFRRIASQADHNVLWGYLGYVTQVEILRLKGEGPPIPDFVESAYLDVLSNIPQWVFELSSFIWDYRLCSAATAALAVSKGQADLAWIIVGIGEDNLKEAKIALGMEK